MTLSVASSKPRRRAWWLLWASLAIHVPIAVVAVGKSKLPNADLDNYYDIATRSGRPYVDFPVEFPVATAQTFRTLAPIVGDRERFGASLVILNVVADGVIAGALGWGWGIEAAACYAFASAGGGYAAELSAEDRARQAQLLVEECAKVDVVITTALIGGVFAPRLISANTVRSMKPGSIIVDLGADGGGNCELSKPGEIVRTGGVTIIAPLNVPATMPNHASLLFSRNLTAFLLAFTKDKAFHVDLADDIQQAAIITFDGQVKHARTREALQKETA